MGLQPRPGVTGPVGVDQLRRPGITVLDGEIVVLSPNGDPDRLVKSRRRPDDAVRPVRKQHRQRPGRAPPPPWASGVPRSAVVEGLRTFAPDPEHNWGRLNTYSLPLPSGGKATVIMDMAHNEAGLEALLDVARGLAAPGGAVRLGLGCAGDRTDEAIIAMGEIAGRGADEVAAQGRTRPLPARSQDRGPRGPLPRRAGQGRGRSTCPATTPSSRPSRPSSPHALDGDVVALMCHAERAEVDGWIREHGGRSTTPARSGARSSPRGASTSSRTRSRRSGRPTTTQAGCAAAQQLVDGHPGDAAAGLRAGRRQGRAGRRAGRHRRSTRRLWPAACASRTGTAPSSSSRRACASSAAPPRRRASSPTSGGTAPGQHCGGRRLPRAGRSTTPVRRGRALRDLLTRGRDDQHRPGRRPLPPGADAPYAAELRRPRLTTRSTSDVRRGCCGVTPSVPAHGGRRPRARIGSSVAGGGVAGLAAASAWSGCRGRGRGRPTAVAGCACPAWACLVRSSSSATHRRVLVDAHDDEVAGVGAGHDVPDRLELVEDDLDLAAARALRHRGRGRPRRRARPSHPACGRAAARPRGRR